MLGKIISYSEASNANSSNSSLIFPLRKHGYRNLQRANSSFPGVQLTSGGKYLFRIKK